MERPFEFREKLLLVHKPNRINRDLYTAINGIVINESWSIFLPEHTNVILSNAARDLQDYFLISMNQYLPIVSSKQEHQIILQVTLQSERPSYQITADQYILLNGTDEKMTAQAIYALEDQMNLNEGPVVQRQDQVYSPLFSPRIIHTGLGDDLYPDEHLQLLAHYGYNAIVVSSAKILDDERVAAKINDIVKRSSAYGFDVYTYNPFKKHLHPSNPEASSYYDGLYGQMFRLCPDLKGIFFVGESCEFPSKDLRTSGKPWRESRDDTNPSPGWFPCSDYPEFFTLLRDVIQKVKPDAHLIVWNYNWGYTENSLRTNLIHAMPAKGFSLMAGFEMYQSFDPQPNVREFTTDFTLNFAGPSNSFLTEAEAASAREIPFLTMCNTSGATWDIATVPYLPAPYQWIKRYENLIACQSKGLLSGLMESYTYGFWPSFLPELAKSAFTEPRPDLYELLKRIAVRDYGAKNAQTVLKAWELFSEGIRHCISTNEDQFGPSRIGPSYPFFFETWGKLPRFKDHVLDPNWLCCPVYRFNPDEMERLCYEIEEYKAMTKAFEEGNRLLISILPDVESSKYASAQEALSVSRFIENTARTITHLKRWHKAKIHLGIYVEHACIWSGGRKDLTDALSPKKPLDIRSNREYWINELISIGYAEIQNALNTIPLVQANSRLGYNPEFDYGCCEEQLLWKIERLHTTLESEVKPLLHESI